MPLAQVSNSVLYFPDTDTDNPLPAVITKVHGGNCVNLTVFGDDARERTDAAELTSISQRSEANTTGVWDFA